MKKFVMVGAEDQMMELVAEAEAELAKQIGPRKAHAMWVAAVAENSTVALAETIARDPVLGFSLLVPALQVIRESLTVLACYSVSDDSDMDNAGAEKAVALHTSVMKRYQELLAELALKQVTAAAEPVNGRVH